MRAKLIETNLPDRHIHVIFNNDTATIPAGTPVILNLSATKVPSTSQNGKPAGYQDGMAVVLPSTAGATASAILCYGVSLGTLPVNNLGESTVHGMVNYALVTIATRASSTASWSTLAAVAALVLLAIDTVNNAFVTTTGGVAGNPPDAILVDSIASMAASASATTDTRTAIVQGFRVFVRMM